MIDGFEIRKDMGYVRIYHIPCNTIVAKGRGDIDSVCQECKKKPPKKLNELYRFIWRFYFAVKK